MTMIATAKKSGNFIPGSGVGFNPGRIAGGRATLPPHGKSGVFGTRPYSDPIVQTRRGGLIDKIQQINPAATAGLPHPFNGPSYRPTNTKPLLAATVATNNIPGKKIFSPTVEKVVVSDKGTFFQRKQTPIIKTQGGAAKTGPSPKSDTAFHPQSKKVVPTPVRGKPQVESTKLVNTAKPPSFQSHGNIWNDPNNSFVRGQHSVAGKGAIGMARWNTTKRSAV